VIRVNSAVKPIRVSSYLGALVIGGLLQASMAAADAPSSDSQGPNAQPSVSVMVVGVAHFSKGLATCSAQGPFGIC